MKHFKIRNTKEHAAASANVMIEALYQPEWKDAQQERLGNMVTYLEEQGVKKIGVQWVEKQDSQDTTRFRIKLY